MFRWFDYLAFLNIPDWSYIIAAVGSAVGFGVIIGAIISSAIEGTQ